MCQERQTNTQTDRQTKRRTDGNLHKYRTSATPSRNYYCFKPLFLMKCQLKNEIKKHKLASFYEGAASIVVRLGMARARYIEVETDKQTDRQTDKKMEKLHHKIIIQIVVPYGTISFILPKEILKNLDSRQTNIHAHKPIIIQF